MTHRVEVCRERLGEPRISASSRDSVRKAVAGEHLVNGADRAAVEGRRQVGSRVAVGELQHPDGTVGVSSCALRKRAAAESRATCAEATAVAGTFTAPYCNRRKLRLTPTRTAPALVERRGGGVELCLRCERHDGGAELRNVLLWCDRLH